MDALSAHVAKDNDLEIQVYPVDGKFVAYAVDYPEQAEARNVSGAVRELFRRIEDRLWKEHNDHASH